MEGDADHPRLGKAEPVQVASKWMDGRVSPDGRWLAYVSAAESVHPDVFVRPFPGPGPKSQVSTTGGGYPVWSRNRDELFFVDPDQRIMVTSYTVAGNSFIPGTPRVWSDERLGSVMVANTPYDLAPNGERFAVVLDTEDAREQKALTGVTLVLNFFDELRMRWPAGRK
jgi:serine/threonine-protein kinase